jgi:hypothetical protein
MFEIFKKFGHSEHGRFHDRRHGPWHGHGYGRTESRQEIPPQSGALPPEASLSQCPLCEKHCLLNSPGCRKGAAFALQQFTPRKEPENEQ